MAEDDRKFLTSPAAGSGVDSLPPIVTNYPDKNIVLDQQERTARDGELQLEFFVSIHSFSIPCMIQLWRD